MIAMPHLPIPDLNQPLRSRHIRVFLSSTFRDMDEERTQLVMRTFPRLRRLARERGVELTEVDLRWGITEEDAKNGKVLRICLNEIDRCREVSGTLPFFIGLVGERYGWVPGSGLVEPDTLKRMPSIEGYLEQGLSVTEMEFIHGVIDSMCWERSWFFIRAPEYTLQLRERHPLVPFRDEDDASLSPEQVNRAKHRLQALREKLAKSQPGHQPPATYASSEALDLLVEEAFRGFLEANFSLEAAGADDAFSKMAPELEGLLQMRIDHAEFAHSRLEHYIGGEVCLPRLEKLLETSSSILVTGVVGSGKSALLANLAKHLQHIRPDVPVLYHFCGGARDSAKLDWMLSRLIEELQFHSDAEIKVPTDPMELPGAFRSIVASVPPSKPIILLLDALDQLDDLKEMRWWPTNIPEQVHIITSLKTEPSSSSAEKSKFLATPREYLIKCGCAEFAVDPLDEHQRVEFLKSLLGAVAKDVPETLLTEIAQGKESSKPLVLRILAEEMRLHGNHNTLDELVRKYTSSRNTEEFFKQVLMRISSLPKAPEILTLIGASVTGLTESEILELMNPGDLEQKYFSRLDWAVLHEHLRMHLRVQDGCIQWFHDLVRKCVETEYLGDQAITRNKQKELADFFLTGERRIGEHGLREWPELLARIGDKERLKTELSRLDAAEKLAEKLPAKLRQWWMATGCGADEIEKIYELAWGDKEPGEKSSALETFVEDWVGRFRWPTSLSLQRLCFLQEMYPSNHELVLQAMSRAAWYQSVTHRLNEALMLRKKVFAHRSKTFGLDHERTISAKRGLAIIYSKLGRHKKALRMFESLQPIYQKHYGDSSTQFLGVLCNISTEYAYLGYNKKSFEIDSTCFRLSMTTNGSLHPDTIAARNNLAFSFSSLGKYSEALKLREEVFADRCRIFGADHPDTIGAKSNIANSYSDLSLHHDALRLREEVFADLLVILGSNHLDTIRAMNSLANSLSDLSRHHDALRLREEVFAERLEILGANHRDTISAKSELGSTYSDLGRHQESLGLHKEVFEYRMRILGWAHPDTIEAKNKLAESFSGLRRHNDALSLREEVLADRVKILHTDHPHTITAKSNLACSYFDIDRHDEALRLREEVFADRNRVLGSSHADTISAKLNLADSYSEFGRHSEALQFREEALADRTRLFGSHNLATINAKNNLANSAFKLGHFNDALQAYREVLEIRLHSQGEYHPATISAKYNIAITLFRLGCDQESLNLRKEIYAEQIRILGPDHMDTILAKNSIAWILTKRLGCHEEALSLAREATKSMTRHIGPEHQKMLHLIDTFANCLEGLGRWGEALPLRGQNFTNCEKALGIGHPKTIQAKVALDNVLQHLES